MVSRPLCRNRCSTETSFPACRMWMVSRSLALARLSLTLSRTIRRPFLCVDRQPSVATVFLPFGPLPPPWVVPPAAGAPPAAPAASPPAPALPALPGGPVARQRRLVRGGVARSREDLPAEHHVVVLVREVVAVRHVRAGEGTERAVKRHRLARVERDHVHLSRCRPGGERPAPRSPWRVNTWCSS